MNQEKQVTVTFRSKPKDYETAIANVKEALIQARDADIQKGTFEIRNVQINIETLCGGK